MMEKADTPPREAVEMTIRLSLYDEGDCADALSFLWNQIHAVQRHMAMVRSKPKMNPDLPRAGASGVTVGASRRFDGRFMIAVLHPLPPPSRASMLAWRDDMARMVWEGQDLINMEATHGD